MAGPGRAAASASVAASRSPTLALPLAPARVDRGQQLERRPVVELVQQRLELAADRDVGRERHGAGPRALLLDLRVEQGQQRTEGRERGQDAERLARVADLPASRDVRGFGLDVRAAVHQPANLADRAQRPPVGRQPQARVDAREPLRDRRLEPELARCRGRRGSRRGLIPRQALREVPGHDAALRPAARPRAPVRPFAQTCVLPSVRPWVDRISAGPT